MLNDTPEYMKEVPEKPAAHQIFDIAEDTTNMSWTDKYIFHHFDAQLLYLSNLDLLDI